LSLEELWIIIIGAPTSQVVPIVFFVTTFVHQYHLSC